VLRVLRLLLELALLGALLYSLLLRSSSRSVGISRVLGAPRYIGVGVGGGCIPLRGTHRDALGRPPPWGFGTSIVVPGALGGLS
jgi:hypothetical protein